MGRLTSVSIAFGTAVHEIFPAVSAERAAMVAEHARVGLDLDSYAMGMAMTCAQVRTRFTRTSMRPWRRRPSPSEPALVPPTLTAHCLFPQPLLIKHKLHWHASLTAGFLLAAKILNDDRVFASDAQILNDDRVFASPHARTATTYYTSKALIELEQRAFSVVPPILGGIYDRALIFRVALLDLALDSNPAPPEVFLGHFHILIAQADAALRAEQTALARFAAPNATVHAVGSYAEALDYADAQTEADSPIHIVLLGVHAVCDSATNGGEAEALIDALNPRGGGLAIDMRVKPLIAMVSSVPQLPGISALYFRGVDVVVDDHNLTANDMQILLDFA